MGLFQRQASIADPGAGLLEAVQHRYDLTATIRVIVLSRRYVGT